MRSTRTTGTPTRRLAVAATAACSGVNIAFVVWVLARRPVLNNDFRGIWSFAIFAHLHAAQLYQAVPLEAFQRSIYPGFRSFFPYQYPPDFLLPLLWLGDFRFAAAETIWTLAGLGALGLAAALFFRPGFRWFGLAALLASPACLLNGAAGETGYFSAALLMAGFAVLPAWPMLAGIAFGLLTLKPQLALFIPVALLARGDFQALIATALTALALISLSCVVFPGGLWLDWVQLVPVYQAQYLAARGSLDLNTQVTVGGNLIVLGVPHCIAWAVQAVTSLGGAAAVFLVFRRAPHRLAVATLFAGMFICAPHAYAYDTLPLVAAITVLEAESTAGIAAGVAVYLAPYLLLTGESRWFLYAIPQLALFLVLIYLAIRPAPRPNICDEPVPSAKLPGKREPRRV